MQRQILAVFSRLRRALDFSVVFITHDLSLLVEFADRIAVMCCGRIVEEAPSAEIYRAPLHPYSDGLLHSFPALRGPRRELTGIAGSPPDPRSLRAGCAFHPRCSKAFDRCGSRTPALGAPADLAATGSGTRRTVACWLHPAADADPMRAAARSQGPDPSSNPSSSPTAADTAV